MASANEINDALASGRIDAGLVNFYVSMPAEAKSSGYAKIYRVSYFTKSAPQSFVLVHLDSNYSSILDLKGKKIGVHPGGASKVGMKFLLQAHNMSTKDVEIIEIKPELQLQTLQSKNINALHALEPVATTAIQKGIARPIVNETFSYTLDPMPIVGPYISSKFIK